MEFDVCLAGDFREARQVFLQKRRELLGRVADSHIRKKLLRSLRSRFEVGVKNLPAARGDLHIDTLTKLYGVCPCPPSSVSFGAGRTIVTYRFRSPRL